MYTNRNSHLLLAFRHRNKFLWLIDFWKFLCAAITFIFKIKWMVKRKKQIVMIGKRSCQISYSILCSQLMSVLRLNATFCSEWNSFKTVSATIISAAFVLKHELPLHRDPTIHIELRRSQSYPQKHPNNKLPCANCIYYLTVK